MAQREEERKWVTTPTADTATVTQMMSTATEAAIVGDVSAASAGRTTKTRALRPLDTGGGHRYPVPPSTASALEIRALAEQEEIRTAKATARRENILNRFKVLAERDENARVRLALPERQTAHIDGMGDLVARAGGSVWGFTTTRRLNFTTRPPKIPKTRTQMHRQMWLRRTQAAREAQTVAEEAREFAEDVQNLGTSMGRGGGASAAEQLAMQLTARSLALFTGAQQEVEAEEAAAEDLAQLMPGQPQQWAQPSTGGGLASDQAASDGRSRSGDNVTLAQQASILGGGSDPYSLLPTPVLAPTGVRHIVGGQKRNVSSFTGGQRPPPLRLPGDPEALSVAVSNDLEGNSTIHSANGADSRQQQLQASPPAPWPGSRPGGPLAATVNPQCYSARELTGGTTRPQQLQPLPPPGGGHKNSSLRRQIAQKAQSAREVYYQEVYYQERYTTNVGTINGDPMLPVPPDTHDWHRLKIIKERMDTGFVIGDGKGMVSKRQLESELHYVAPCKLPAFRTPRDTPFHLRRMCSGLVPKESRLPPVELAVAADGAIPLQSDGGGGRGAYHPYH